MKIFVRIGGEHCGLNKGHHHLHAYIGVGGPIAQLLVDYIASILHDMGLNFSAAHD